MMEMFEKAMASNDVAQIREAALCYIEKGDAFSAEKLYSRAIALGDTSVSTYLSAAVVLKTIVAATRVTIASYSDTQYERIERGMQYIQKVAHCNDALVPKLKNDFLREKAICLYFEGEEKSDLKYLNEAVAILERLPIEEDIEAKGYLGLALFDKIKRSEVNVTADQRAQCFLINKRMAYNEAFTQRNLSLFNLGFMYLEGNCCLKDSDAAYRCFVELKQRGCNVDNLLGEFTMQSNGKYRHQSDKPEKKSARWKMVVLGFIIFAIATNICAMAGLSMLNPVLVVIFIVWLIWVLRKKRK